LFYALNIFAKTLSKNMNISELLMPLEEYAKLPPSPGYTYSITKGKKELVYYGSNHYDGHNPDSPQNNEIKNLWNRFTKGKDPKTCVALIEGGRREIPDHEEASIKKHGEAGLVTFLAKGSGIEVYSPDPNPQEEFESIQNKAYTTAQIEYYYLAREVVQWHRIKDQVSFNDYIAAYFTKRREQLTHSSSFSIRGIRKVHQDLFGGEFDEHDRDFFRSITNPAFRVTVINLIAQDTLRIRDTHIVQEIIKEWSKEKSVFIVFGSAHALIQEPALRKMLP
jgi:hypothetical protein